MKKCPVCDIEIVLDKYPQGVIVKCQCGYVISNPTNLWAWAKEVEKDTQCDDPIGRILELLLDLDKRLKKLEE